MGASAAARLERALIALGVDHDIGVYPDAGHGFISHHDPGGHDAVAGDLEQGVRHRYHEPSALDARRRIVAFFHRNLGT